ncbi:MAG: hypothetical protein ABIQ32_12635 [Sphingomicrobium sp.]
MARRNSAGRTPVHLWIVAALATLWNGFGCYDYLMTQTRGADYVRSMMPGADAEAIMSYVNGLPLWATGAWALGVWGGLLGSALLLARHRWAAPALGISFVGALIGIGYQLLNPSPVADMHEGVNGVMPYVIIVVALGLFLYARAMSKKGVLR